MLRYNIAKYDASKNCRTTVTGCQVHDSQVVDEVLNTPYWIKL
jgi:hypothetical protein